ncbi:hypothetical protein CQW23_07733 [Capsicum baccatum]|uniref:Uncharacterized protein n=1 Tax=Capsicum baccatum TaxID=33114 RepID=A0A2G2X7G2_CAPBA|nr:hypothetical protein CQW23_07733 [Capsicum baccatum]
MRGAETTEKGDCSAVRGSPQCCEKDPVIVDLLLGVSYNIQTINYCKGGVLTSMTRDPERYGASFEMGIGSASDDGYGPRIPENFTLGIPRYTCGQPFPVPPSYFSVDKGRRKTKAIAEKFAAAAGRNPVCNLALIVGTTDIPYWYYFEAFGSEAKSNFKVATSVEHLALFYNKSPTSPVSKVCFFSCIYVIIEMMHSRINRIYHGTIIQVI